MPDTPTIPEAPATFRGEEVWILAPHPERPYRRGDGSRLEAQIIPTLSAGQRTPRYYVEPGKDYLFPDEAVYGVTYYQDRFLGLGLVAHRQHAGWAINQLQLEGYVFHQARPDIEPVLPLREYIQQYAHQYAPDFVTRYTSGALWVLGEPEPASEPAPESTEAAILVEPALTTEVAPLPAEPPVPEDPEPVPDVIIPPLAVPLPAPVPAQDEASTES